MLNVVQADVEFLHLVDLKADLLSQLLKVEKAEKLVRVENMLLAIATAYS
jgi:hypothetical protein